MNRQILIACSQAFVSFLFRTPGIKSSDIKSIFLFGSVARGDFDEESDMDIFINTDKNNEKELIKFSKIALKNFYKSDEGKKFALFGAENSISVKCGNIEKWGLFDSIKSEGLVLYSSSISPFFRKYFLVEMKPVSDISKRNKIIRKLAGRKEKNRKEKGLVEQIGGQVLDSRHYIVPAEKISSITKVLSKENAIFEIREIWM